MLHVSHLKKAIFGLLLLWGALSSTVNAQSFRPWPSAVVNLDCDRECLFELLDGYLDGLVNKDPAQVTWAKHVKFTENNVPLAVGDGLWGTITGMGDYELKSADVSSGQISFFGVVNEPKFSSLFSLRLKVENKGISEVETVVLRMIDEPKGIVWPEPIMVDKPIFSEVLAESEMRGRERLISIADGYFDTLQLNDGTLFTTFHEDCDRVENGTKTTNNTEVAVTAVGAWGCEEQFKLGNYLYDDRLRARRYPLVDEERGLVLASAFIDHSGRVGKYKLSNGEEVEAPLRYPHSFYLLELFKIVDGKIRQIEAVFVTVPYGMASPWVD